MMRNVHIPGVLKQLASVFHEAQYECYLVGGAIRDLLLKRPTNDFDIATNASPQAVQGLFKRVIPTGIKHGTVTVIYKDYQFEVTTYRIDDKYSDSRHPDSITYSSSIEEDLKRRDFTINGLAYNLETNNLLDLHHGIEDLNNGIIRAIGDPVARFTEDGLRPLRACRFAAQLHFTIEPATQMAIKNPRVIAGIKQVSQERIRDELLKIIQAEHIVYGFELLRDSALLNYVLPELTRCIGIEQREMHCFDVFYHSLYSCQAAPRDELIVRLAALLHDLGKATTLTFTPEGIPRFLGHEKASAELAIEILQRLKFPNATIDTISHLIRHHMFDYQEEWKDAAVRRLISRVGNEYMDSLFSLRIADAIGHCNKPVVSTQLLKLKARIETMRKQELAVTLKDLQVDGRILMERLSLPPGPQVGKILDFLLESVLEDPNLNEQHKLLELAQQFYEKRILPLTNHYSDRPIKD